MQFAEFFYPDAKLYNIVIMAELAHDKYILGDFFL